MKFKYRSYRDKSGRLTVSLEGMPLLAYSLVGWKLRMKFKLKKIGSLVSSLDERIQKYSVEDNLLSVEWDIWSGFSVTALGINSEELVSDIGAYLKYSYGRK